MHAHTIILSIKVFRLFSRNVPHKQLENQPLKLVCPVHLCRYFGQIRPGFAKAKPKRRDRQGKQAKLEKSVKITWEARLQKPHQRGVTDTYVQYICAQRQIQSGQAGKLGSGIGKCETYFQKNTQTHKTDPDLCVRKCFSNTFRDLCGREREMHGWHRACICEIRISFEDKRPESTVSVWLADSRRKGFSFWHGSADSRAPTTQLLLPKTCLVKGLFIIPFGYLPIHINLSECPNPSAVFTRKLQRIPKTEWL